MKRRDLFRTSLAAVAVGVTGTVGLSSVPAKKAVSGSKDPWKITKEIMKKGDYEVDYERHDEPLQVGDFFLSDWPWAVGDLMLLYFMEKRQLNSVGNRKEHWHTESLNISILCRMRDMVWRPPMFFSPVHVPQNWTLCKGGDKIREWAKCWHNYHNGKETNPNWDAKDAMDDVVENDRKWNRQKDFSNILYIRGHYGENPVGTHDNNEKVVLPPFRMAMITWAIKDFYYRLPPEKAEVKKHLRDFFRSKGINLRDPKA